MHPLPSHESDSFLRPAESDDLILQRSLHLVMIVNIYHAPVIQVAPQFLLKLDLNSIEASCYLEVPTTNLNVPISISKLLNSN